MKSAGVNASHFFRCACFVLAATFLLAGCASMRAARTITPLSNRDNAELTAEQVIDVMRLAGYRDSEIVDLGPYLRDALASSGAARVEMGDRVDAMFVVEFDRIYVSTHTHGTFIYDLEDGEPVEPQNSDAVDPADTQ